MLGQEAENQEKLDDIPKPSQLVDPSKAHLWGR